MTKKDQGKNPEKKSSAIGSKRTARKTGPAKASSTKRSAKPKEADNAKPERKKPVGHRGKRPTGFGASKPSFAESKDNTRLRPKRGTDNEGKHPTGAGTSKTSFAESRNNTRPRPKRSTDREANRPTGAGAGKQSFAESRDNTRLRPKRSIDDEGKRPTGASAVDKTAFAKSEKKDKKPDHTSGWKSESELSTGSRRKTGPTQYRKASGKTWKGKPVVEVRHTMRLNKYISNAGICSRREADNLIAQGLIEVNGGQVTEMGYQVKEEDKVTYAGERISPEKPAYVLLNKPKDYITTAKENTENHRSVMMLLQRVGNFTLFPVGRMDRTTTGLLLLTNDGKLSKKLTHPTQGVKKLYHVHLDKACKAVHLKAILDGVELEDGTIKAEVIEYVADGKDKKQIGIELSSPKNRIVRRLFEHLGYKVLKLDRVTFAGLTKKDLPRGKWRHLTEQELNRLKMV